MRLAEENAAREVAKLAERQAEVAGGGWGGGVESGGWEGGVAGLKERWGESFPCFFFEKRLRREVGGVFGFV